MIEARNERLFVPKAVHGARSTQWQTSQENTPRNKGRAAPGRSAWWNQTLQSTFPPPGIDNGG